MAVSSGVVSSGVASSEAEYKVLECIVCGVIYNEKLGWPEEGLTPGTRWADVPVDWLCPDCGVGKDDFEMIELSLDQPSGMPGAAPLAVSPKPSEDQYSKVAADTLPSAETSTSGYRQWECVVCGIVYDEAKGWPDEGIAPGTRWQDVPADWLCPDCGVGKSDFEMLEVSVSNSEKESSEASHAIANDVAVSREPVSTIDYSKAPIVIIGSGLAGYNLAREIRKLDGITPMVMVTADDGDFYSKPQLSTGFAKNKPAAALVSGAAESMAQQLQLQLHIYSRVSNIDTEAQTIEFSGRQLRYGKLVFATGAECISAPIQGSAASQVYTVNDLMDYARFRTATVSCKKILVIGAGLIGSEYANDLIQAGLEVDVVDPMPTPLASLLPIQAGQALQAALEAAGVNFHLGTVVDSLEASKSNTTGVLARLKNGTVIEADIVLSAIGVRARTQLAEQAGIEIDRGIVVDRSLKTSQDNVYALGDCAQVDGHLLYYIAPLMVGARALAKTLTGQDTEVCYGAMPVAVKTTLCPVTVSPPARDAEGQWEVQKLNERSIKAEFLSPQGELLGFALTADATQQKDKLLGALPDVMA
ncbi:MAG: FAD-dependent oxidoreductase [Cellvibrionaceae bacterium]